jgi:glycosyltransferase involved in cell wall biosynthesis
VKAAIVIPAFNESRSIANVVSALHPFGIPIVVDDGSSDDTGARATAAGAVVVHHSENRGYDAALASGFARAESIGADVIVTIDADGQLDPNAVPLALSALKDRHAALVLGTRSTGAGRWSEALFNRYMRLRFGVPDILCGLKAFRVESYQTRGHQLAGQGVNTTLAFDLIRRGECFKLVPVTAKPRLGNSRFGAGWRGNIRILRAFADALLRDLRVR